MSARYSADRFPPGFFDLPAGAGTTLPIDVISMWTRSAQTATVARQLLTPHALQGIVASSDSSGLTRLARERPLIDILAMIGEPKEIIHACGRAIGGRAIGIWAADNTTMFYSSAVATVEVTSMLRTTMLRVGERCELAVGIAAHMGTFFELNGAIYGADAECVEVVAEDHTGGGELVVTESIVRDLPDGQFTLHMRDDLRERFGQVFRIVDGPVIDALEQRDVAYPAPYSSVFTTELTDYARTRRDSRVPRQAYEDLTVVLIECEPDNSDVAELCVLNDLALTAAMQRIGRSLLPDHNGLEVKVVRLLGIYTFSVATIAITFAKAFRALLDEQGVRCRIGIDAGKVLVFDLGGSHDIAGSAVNVASKLAQEVGDYGRIQCSDTVVQRAGVRPPRSTLTLHVSGVDLRAYDV